MYRYLTDFNLSSLEVINTDVLVVGSGIAGLYASLNIDRSKNCTIITKMEIESSNSWLAQGGIAAVIDPDDKFELHIEDTLTAGAGLSDIEAVRVLVSEGPKDIHELVRLNVPFDINPEGELQITREGGHSYRRIVHCGGDATGRETTRRLGQIALEQKNINVLFKTHLVDILTVDGAVYGALVFDETLKLIRCSNIIIATGGIGYVYKYTTNPSGAVGDGIAAAARAGAEISLMEMVQFHPTTLIAQTESDRLFLISEAVRGEGGVLRNLAGERFMVGKHKLAELAPRDIVTRFILQELQRTGDSNVLLDVSSMSHEFFARRFPTIYSQCRQFDILVPDEPIPVRPAQHYLMGGIKTDLWGMTNIDGLYACGETACTGIHGANRLASNSVLECLVFGRRAAQHINAQKRAAVYKSLPEIKGRPSFGERSLSLPAMPRSEARELRNQIGCIMSEKAGAIRTPTGLSAAQKELTDIFNKIKSYHLTDPYEFELASMSQIALMVVESALARKESVGAHYLVDDKE